MQKSPGLSKEEKEKQRLERECLKLERQKELEEKKLVKEEEKKRKEEERLQKLAEKEKKEQEKKLEKEKREEERKEKERLVVFCCEIQYNECLIKNALVVITFYNVYTLRIKFYIVFSTINFFF